MSGGSGSLTLADTNPAPGTLTLAAANDFTGGTTITGGTLALAADNALPAGGAVTINGGNLDVGTSTNAVGAVALSSGNISGTTGVLLEASFAVGNSSGTATIGAILGGTGGLTKTGAGTLVLSGASTYAGDTAINAGVVQLAGDENLGVSGPLGVGGTISFGGGTLQFSSGNQADYSARFSTTDAQTIKIDTNGQNVTFAQPLLGITAGGLTVNDTGATPGVLTLTGASNYTGPTTITRGTLNLDSAGALSTQSAVTFNGSGTFVYTGAAAGNASYVGPLTLVAGDATVQSTYGTSDTTVLNFSALAPRAAGATVNFVLSGGTAGTPGNQGSNVINFTSPPAAVDPGLFFGGSDFAYYDTVGQPGFLRAIAYGTDPTSESISASTPSFTAGMQYELITGSGAITAQTDQTITTLNIANSNDLTLADGATLGVSGILKSGNAAGGTIGGGAGLMAATAGGEIVVRTDGPGDTLTIDTPIVNNASASALTKSGPGTLTLTGTNTYSGTTFINDGTLRVTGSGKLGSGAIVDNGAVGFRHQHRFHQRLDQRNRLVHLGRRRRLDCRREQFELFRQLRP